MCPASSASLLVESLQPTPYTSNTSEHIITKTYNKQHATIMAPGRPIGVKTKGGKAAKPPSVALVGVVSLAKVSAWASLAQRGTCRKCFLATQGNNTLIHSQKGLEGQHPGNRQRRHSPTRPPWWCQAHLGHDLRRDTPGTQVLPREGYARKCGG